MPLNLAATSHRSRLPTTIVQGKKPRGGIIRDKTKGVMARKQKYGTKPGNKGMRTLT
jgi:hypothetical protein